MLPLTIKPMLATPATPFDSADFTYEIKWDGYRCLAFIEKDTRLQSRNQKDLTLIFPELRQIHQKIASTGCVLDGEIIALRNGKPSFPELQKRAQLRNEQQIRQAVHNTPVVYVVFDILYLNNQPIYDLALEKRRDHLAKIINSGDESILTSFVVQQGRSFFHAISEMGLEGVIAKQVNSVYLPGKRTKSWLKFKRRQIKNFIICGYVHRPSARGDLSSLILGAYLFQKLTPFGMVGTGFNSEQLTTLKTILDQIATAICPFTGVALIQKDVVWSEPLLVCEVEYLELTDDGSLRHPSFKRLREDLKPINCQFEE